MGDRTEAWFGRRASRWRPRAKWFPNLPFMAEWIEDSAQPPAVLVGHPGRHRGPGPNRLREHRVRIIDHEQSPARRTADRRRAETGCFRTAGRHPERGVADRQLRNDVIAFADLVKDHGTEGRLVERNRCGSTIDPQLRLDTRHAR